MKDFELEKWMEDKFLFRFNDGSFQDASMTEILLYKIFEELEKLNKSKFQKRK